MGDHRTSNPEGGPYREPGIVVPEPKVSKPTVWQTFGSNIIGLIVMAGSVFALGGIYDAWQLPLFAAVHGLLTAAVLFFLTTLGVGAFLAVST